MTQKKYTYDVSRKFVKSFKRYNIKTKKKITQKIDVFLEDPYQPALKTHKLTGKWKDYWAFSIEYNVRIMFKFVANDKVEFINFGPHGIYG